MSEANTSPRWLASTTVGWISLLYTLAGVIISCGGVEESSVCVNFSVGNSELSELYSPFYPSRYTNHTDCVRILTAEPGQVVRIYVHEFDMEVSDMTCKYDWLEVRDGPFGYSPLLGRYCGGKSPLILISTTRYMWLGFHSDDTVEGGGFRIGYQYLASNDPDVPDPDKNQLPICLINVRLDNFTSTLVRSSDIQPSFKMHHAIDCTWNITAPASRRVAINFPVLSATRSCSEASVELYETNTMLSSRLRQYCAGSVSSTELNSGDNRLFLRLRASTNVFQPAFEVHLTAFQTGTLVGTIGSCPEHLFHCGNNDCIHPQLVCNGAQNCVSGLDELHCFTTTTVVVTTSSPVNAALFTVHTITIVTVAGVILLFAIVSLIVTCKHFATERLARRERQRERSEQMTWKLGAAALQLRETALLINKSAMDREPRSHEPPLPIAVSNGTDDAHNDVDDVATNRRRWDALSNGPSRTLSKGADRADGLLLQEEKNDNTALHVLPQGNWLLPPPPGYKDAHEYDSSPNLSFNNEPLCTEATIEVIAPPSSPFVADTKRVKSSDNLRPAASDAGFNSSGVGKLSPVTVTFTFEHDDVGQNNDKSNGDKGRVNGIVYQTVKGRKPAASDVAETAAVTVTKSDSLRKSSSHSNDRDSLSRLVQSKPQQLSPQPPPRGDQKKSNGRAMSSLPRAVVATSHEVALAASSPPPTSSGQGHTHTHASPHSPTKLSVASPRLQTFQAKIGQRCANHTLVGPYSSVGGLGLEDNRSKPVHRGTLKRRDPAQTLELRRSRSVESALSEAGEIWKPLHLNGLHTDDVEQETPSSAKGGGGGGGKEGGGGGGGRVPQPVNVASLPLKPSLSSHSAAQSSRQQHVTINATPPTTNGNHAPGTATKRSSNFVPLVHCGQQQQSTRPVSLEVDV